VQEKVLAWINDNFILDDIIIQDFPLFPAGKRLIDRNGEEMVVFFDFLHDRIDYIFPKKIKS
jgi:hypothetical protein